MELKNEEEDDVEESPISHLPQESMSDDEDEAFYTADSILNRRHEHMGLVSSLLPFFSSRCRHRLYGGDVEAQLERSTSDFSHYSSM